MTTDLAEIHGFSYVFLYISILLLFRVFPFPVFSFPATCLYILHLLIWFQTIMSLCWFLFMRLIFFYYSFSLTFHFSLPFYQLAYNSTSISVTPISLLLSSITCNYKILYPERNNNSSYSIHFVSVLAFLLYFITFMCTYVPPIPTCR